MKVLLIEDFDLIRDSVAQGLREAGFAVDTAPDGQQGLWLARAADYDVIILDLMLPRLDGLSLLKTLRKGGSRTHVLILTARDRTEDRVKGLDLGADDYLVKPFVFAELLARVRALVRRRYDAKSPLIRVGDLEIDTAARMPRRGGEAIELSAREYALLELLAYRAGQQVLCMDIWEHLYEFDSPADSNVVDVFIGHLRRKLERDDLPRLIHTRRGLGYMLGGNEMRFSLEARLLAGTAAVTVLAVAGAALAIYLSVRASLVAEFDASLSRRTPHVLASLTEQTPRGVIVEIDPLMMPEFSRAARPDYFALWSADAAPVALSSAAAGRLRKPALPSAAGQSYSLVLPDGRPGRACILTFAVHTEDADDTLTRAPGAAMVTLLLARETAGMDQMLSRLAILLAGVASATAVVSGGLMALVVRRGSSPVAHLAARIASLGENTLSERLDTPSVPAELRPMVDRLNDLLSRLEAAFVREKAFSADVAHELRTPLAGLESALEVCASRRREPEAYEQTVGRCLAAVRDMHAMVEKLLLLARFESGQVPISPQRANLSELIADCLKPFQSCIADRRLQVEEAIPPDLSLRTDPQHLRIILHNLLDNAISYANDAGTVQITAAEEDAHTVIRVSNTGSTLAPADIERVFERFWRADTARTNTGLHCGLGLALSRRIAQCLSGSLTATSVPGGCFEVVLCLARSAPVPADSPKP